MLMSIMFSQSSTRRSSRGGDRSNAGVIDENVKLAVALTRQVDETRHVLAPSHVSLCIGDFPTRPFDPPSERLQPIQSARAEYDFRAALSEHDRSGFTYAAARPGYDDNLVFNSVYEVFHFQYLIYLDLLGSEPMILVRPTRCQDWLRSHPKVGAHYRTLVAEENLPDAH